MYEIFLDTETTGLSISDDHRIVEIACIETNGLIPTNNVFHKIINPKRKVSDEALKIHGFTDEFLENKKTFKDIAEEFINFIEGKKLIIHNAPFDISFLNHELIKILSILKKSQTHLRLHDQNFQAFQILWIACAKDLISIYLAERSIMHY